MYKFGTKKNQMCYQFSNEDIDINKAVKAFKPKKIDVNLEFLGDVNAFAKLTEPTIPAIVNQDNDIFFMNTLWGTDPKPWSNTKGKNLQSEKTHTIYQYIQNNRCLIPASHYFENKTLFRPGKVSPDRQVKVSVKHKMFWKDQEQFYIGGFYDVYPDGNIGFGLVTTIPNPIQMEIHHRMIMTFDEEMGLKFLQREPIEFFQYPNYSPNLGFLNLEPEKTGQRPNTLFG